MAKRKGDDKFPNIAQITWSPALECRARYAGDSRYLARHCCIADPLFDPHALTLRQIALSRSAARMNDTGHGMDITYRVKRNNSAPAQYEGRNVLHCIKWRILAG